ncbi:MAG TPA: LuxR C-terminal-related transcriptional regulator [Bacteroidia bacterium]|jgi:DNA-binding CsgD family transcriptional regulator|nr:LuxR C-terminal-related transcriptional regulator [Bacteroidia bacterium]
MENLKNYFTEFITLMDVQQFNSNELNYSVLKNHKTQLKQLSNVGNSSVFVFDLCKKEHVFSSGLYENFIDKTDRSVNGILNFLDQTVHVDDSITLIKRWITSLKLCYTAPLSERKNYKIINDYRIKNKNGEMVRVVDQHQVLELDAQGNIWLSLCLIDISPDQNKNQGVKSSIVNFKTGDVIWEDLAEEKEVVNQPALTSREKEILLLIKEGFLSKEIAKKLFLSVHTVNTHRQRILEKLDVNNSIEAIKSARNLGML